MHKNINNWINSKYGPPIFFLFIGLISYVLLINRLGIYWDDWPYLYVTHSIGIMGFPEFVSSDRPFSAWIFILTGFLFGENFLGYHIAIFILRYLVSLTFYWVIQQIWIENKFYNLIATTLFLVYPGFFQLPIALVYSHHLSVLTLQLLSFGLMIKSLQSTRFNKIFLGFSIIFSLSIFSIENFVLLEFLRPLIIFIVLSRSLKNKKICFVKTITTWLPYLSILLIFLFWRIFILGFPTYQVSLLTEGTTPVYINFINIIERIPRDIFVGTIFVWFNNIFQPAINSISIKSYLFLIFIASAIFLFVYLFFSNQSLDKINFKDKRNYGLEYLLIGGFGLVLGGSPAWLTKLTIDPHFPWDRMMLAMIPGAVLTIVGLMILLSKNIKINIIIIALLTVIGSYSQIINTFSYIKDWDQFNDFFYQLHWRAPSIQKNTILLTTNFPLVYYSDNSLTSPLNWVYDPYNHSKELSYFLFFLDSNRLALKDLKNNEDIIQKYRSFFFKGNISEALVFFYEPPGCLHVLDSEIDKFNPTLPTKILDSLKFSDLNLINSHSSEPFPHVFGQEPTRNWCYYYQKAALAQQSKNWAEILILGETSSKLNDYPNDPIERFPFLEAYANTENWGKALEMTKLTFQISPQYKNILCALWSRISRENFGTRFPEEIRSYLSNDLSCQ